MKDEGSGIRGQGSENDPRQASPTQPKIGVPRVRGPHGQVFVRGVGIPCTWGPGNPRTLGALFILLAAFIAIVPQLIRGNPCGHDFNVHLVSWLDCLNAWKHGLVYPHWTPSANYGAGEPRFVFYPPFTWMAGAVLGAIFPWGFAPIVFTFLCLAATGLATRALALEVLDHAAATLAGCATIFSGFALFTAYERAAFPEFTGGFWLPLLLLYALRDRSPSSSIIRRTLDRSTVPLALVLAGAWLSNLPLGVMAGYLLAGVALLAALVNRTWFPVLRAAVATVLGLGLAAIYWLPAALERNWVDIRQATQDPGYNFENNWLFARSANPVLALHDVVLRQVSWIAVTMIAVTVICLAIAWQRGTPPAQWSAVSRRWWISLSVLPFVILFMLFPISRPVWHLLPEMPYLQYPWRWLEALEAPMGIFFAAAVWPAARRARFVVAGACVAAFLAMTFYAATAFFQVCYDEDTVASTLAAYHSGAGFEGMYEYAPPGSDITLIATGLPAACLVSDPAIVLGKPNPDDPNSNPMWSSEQSGCLAAFPEFDPSSAPEHLPFHGIMDRSGYLVLRLLSFPAWTVRVNGTAIGELPDRTDGLMAVPVSAGPVDVAVDWTTTADVVAGRALSALSVLLLVALFWTERRLVRTRLK